MNQLKRYTDLGYQNGKLAGARDLIMKLNEKISEREIVDVLGVQAFMRDEMNSISSGLDQLQVQLDSFHAEVS